MPLSNGLIRQLHSQLLQGVRGEESRGRFRDKQVYIGNRELGSDHARFVPPAHHLIRDLMEKFEHSLSDSGELPILVQLGLQHYQFETIHPFEDGNGRLGRTLMLLGLCQSKLLSQPVINASLHFERQRQTYYDSLLRVSTDGDWNNWLTFFLEGLRVAAIESDEKLRELIDLRREYQTQLHSARQPALLLKLVDHLFIRPIITIPVAAQLLDLTYPAAKNHVEKLVDANVLDAIDRRQPKTFIARRILKALNAEPTRR